MSTRSQESSTSFELAVHRFNQATIVVVADPSGEHQAVLDGLAGIGLRSTQLVSVEEFELQRSEREPSLLFVPETLFSPSDVTARCDASPDVAIIVYAVSRNARLALSYLKHGAVDVLRRDFSDDEFGVVLLRAVLHDSECTFAAGDVPMSDSFDRLLGQIDHLPQLKQVTRSLVREALRRTGGNKSLAGRMLGVTPQAIWNRLNR